MLSFWEKQSLLNYDIIIVGSGIVGLSTAASIKELKPALRVLVLERAILPTGASTKNAGFACIGSLTEILDDLQTMSEAEVLALVEMRLKGLHKLRTRLGDANIDYAENGSHELIAEAETESMHEIDRVNSLLQPVLRGPAFAPADAKLNEYGFAPAVKHLISNHFEGELHTGKMMRTLIDYCLRLGIEIKTGCEVLKVEEEPHGAQVIAAHGYLQQEIAFTAPRVAICTNAFTRSLYPAMDVQPGRGQVLITRPIPHLPFKGIFHFHKGYYYFRTLGNRILLGGGRQLDFEGERSTGFIYNDAIRNDLMARLNTLILPGQPVEVEDWWTGIMAFGANKFPVLMRQSACVFVGVRMGGMGVAIGSHIGEQLADMLVAAD